MQQTGIFSFISFQTHPSCTAHVIQPPQDLQTYKRVALCSCEGLDSPADRCRMNAPLNIALCPHCLCNKPCAATLVVEKSRCTSYVNRRERSALSGTCFDIISTMIASNPFFSFSNIRLHFSCDAAVKMPICNQVHKAPTLFASQSPPILS
jgi:hypothetical protein